MAYDLPVVPQYQLGAPAPVLQAPQVAPPVLPPVTTDPYPQAPAGAITATPQQAVGESLGVNQRKENAAQAQGDVDADTANKEAALHAQEATEQQQHAADFQTSHTQNNAKSDEAHKQLQSAYEDFAAKAGKLGDPSKEFWGDKSTGTKILSGLAAFASGFHMPGEGGENQYLKFLNHQIDQNYDAHKQNIKDLYDKQVAAGKIVDTIANQNKFDEEAKLYFYDLAGMHIKSELAQVAAKGRAGLAPVTAAKAIADIDQDSINRRADYSTKQAQLAAAGAANQRAQEKEVREAIAKQRAGFDAAVTAGTMTPEEADQKAVQSVQAQGFSPARLASAATAVGGTYNPKSGLLEFTPPASATPATEGDSVTLDAKGNPVVPDVMGGRRLSFAEKSKLADDAQKRVITLADGSKGLAPNEEEAKQWPQETTALKAGLTLSDHLLALADDPSKKAEFEQGVKDLQRYAAIANGLHRAPGGGEEGKEGVINTGGINAPATWKTLVAPLQILATGSTSYQDRVAALKGLKDTLQNLSETREGSVQKFGKAVEATPKGSAADIAKAKGWKAL
jgi:hypothetical protein